MRYSLESKIICSTHGVRGPGWRLADWWGRRRDKAPTRIGTLIAMPPRPPPSSALVQSACIRGESLTPLSRHWHACKTSAAGPGGAGRDAHTKRLAGAWRRHRVAGPREPETSFCGRACCGAGLALPEAGAGRRLKGCPPPPLVSVPVMARAAHARGDRGGVNAGLHCIPWL